MRHYEAYVTEKGVAWFHERDAELVVKALKSRHGYAVYAKRARGVTMPGNRTTQVFVKSSGEWKPVKQSWPDKDLIDKVN